MTAVWLVGWGCLVMSLMVSRLLFIPVLAAARPGEGEEVPAEVCVTTGTGGDWRAFLASFACAFCFSWRHCLCDKRHQTKSWVRQNPPSEGVILASMYTCLVHTCTAQIPTSVAQQVASGVGRDLQLGEAQLQDWGFLQECDFVCEMQSQSRGSILHAENLCRSFAAWFEIIEFVNVSDSSCFSVLTDHYSQ